MFCSACVVQAETMTGGETPCALSGEPFAGASKADVCTAFKDALDGTSGVHVYRLELEAVSKTSARAIAYGSDGETLLARDFDIMDRSLDRVAWQDFAGQFVRQLNALHTADK